MKAEQARNGSAILRVRDARKAYGGRRALDGVTLDVAAGEWIGLLGPNGAGKTTLLHAAAGLLDLDGGSIRLFGRKVDSRAGEEVRGHVGFVPQEIALYPSLTAAENLEVFGRLHGLGGGALRERVDWALDWTGLAGRENDRVAAFSGGMKRRLNIACGVLHAPRVVLLDEPTVGVDPHARRRIEEMLEGLRDRGTALVQSTHQFREVESACDRLMILDAGRIIAGGTLHELSARVELPVRPFSIALDRPAAPELVGPGVEVRGTRVTGELRDVAAELPGLLARIHEAGHAVREVNVEAPGLESVFAALTGRELRE